MTTGIFTTDAGVTHAMDEILGLMFWLDKEEAFGLCGARVEGMISCGAGAGEALEGVKNPCPICLAKIKGEANA